MYSAHPTSRMKVTANTCLETVKFMPFDSRATSLATSHGLSINSVSWEDNARTKNSSWGPCISDMTLAVEGTSMPLVKASSNYVDESWDVEIEKIPLVVGNEDGTMLRTVTLKEYLQNFRDYLSNPSSWKGTRKSLLRDDDKHVICSAQACFLPMPKEGDAKFNVEIYNYQSSRGNPAVLAIVASANGTSAEILEGRQRLYHNKNGEKASFIGKRLSDHRRETGSELSSKAPMTSSEKQQNMLLVIQVPIKHVGEIYDDDSDGDECFLESSTLIFQAKNSRCSKEVDVESAIISIGKSEGKHDEIHDCEIERDDRFPIRVTMQYYKATSNGAVDDAVMTQIRDELHGARKWAVAISSLVTETTNRTTEHSVTSYPAWWNGLWTQYSPLYPQYKSREQAELLLFANQRFSGSLLADVQEQVLDILGKNNPSANPPAKVPPSLPSWDV